MSMTRDELRRKLEVLVRIGQVTPAQMEAKLVEFDAQSAQQSQRLQDQSRHPRGYGRGSSPSRPPARSGGNRADMSQYASAPYRFVPFDQTAVVKAEDAALEPINIPKADGLCAEIEVMWEAESPLLIGQQAKGGDNDPNSIVTPLTLGRQTDYFIPGATLRGAIRSIAEIASGAMLSQVNRNRIFPLRDFNHGVYRPQNSAGDDAEYISKVENGHRQECYPVSQVSKVKAGWLRLKQDGSRPKPGRQAIDADWNNSFEILPCDWAVVTAEDLWRSGHINRNDLDRKVDDGESFTKTDMKAKYQSVGCLSNGVVRPHGRLRTFDHAGERYGATRLQPRDGGSVKGHYVFSGKAPNGKKVEFVFYKEGTTVFSVPFDVMQRFRQMHSQAVDETLEPENTWAEVIKAFAKDENTLWPVFYVGRTPRIDAKGKEIDRSAEAPFFFGLTRLFKVPHAWSFDSVLAKSGVRNPTDDTGKVLMDQLDMVDALFGYVYEPEIERNDQKSADFARKGRVAFSSARLVHGANPVVSSPIDTVMMGPRPSFAPFYLKEDSRGFRDYSSEEIPTIAGRKRYPPRFDPENPPQGGSLARVEAKLRRQLDLIAASGKPASNKVKTRLRFLVPQKDARVAFSSRVRLFNVTEAELGLVLWALTFGGNERTHRHMLGRAKGFGAGQMKVEIKKLSVEYNARSEPLAGDVAELVQGFLAKLDAHLDKENGTLAKIKAMRSALLASSDPKLGAKLDQSGKLDNMQLNQMIDGRKKGMFQAMRDMTKPNPRQPTPLRRTFLPLE